MFMRYALASWIDRWMERGMEHAGRGRGDQRETAAPARVAQVAQIKIKLT